MNKEKKIYQVRRVKADLRSGREDEAEIIINSALIELQQDNNIEIIDVIETTRDKSIFTFLIKYWDFGLNN